MKKRITSMFLCLCMVLTLIPTMTIMANAAAGDGIKQKLDTFIQDQYPEGAKFEDLGFHSSYQCYGFAKKVVHYLFGPSTVSGKSIRSWTYAGVSSSGMVKLRQLKKGNYTETNLKQMLSQAKPGDVLQFDVGSYYVQHSMIIYSIGSNSFTVYDANGSSDYNVVHLRTISYDAWKNCDNASLTLLRSDNYDSCDGTVKYSVVFSNPTDPTYSSMRKTDYDNAVVVTKLTKPAGVACTKTGIILYGPNGKEILNYSAPVTNVPASYSFFHVWWDFKNELNYPLQPGTTYTYQFQAEVGGQWYRGTKQTFTTSSIGVKMTVTSVNSSGTAPAHTNPYGEAPITKRYCKGDVVTVIGSTKNSYGNLWYKLSDGSWVVSSYLRK